MRIVEIFIEIYNRGLLNISVDDELNFEKRRARIESHRYWNTYHENSWLSTGLREKTRYPLWLERKIERVLSLCSVLAHHLLRRRILSSTDWRHW